MKIIQFILPAYEIKKPMSKSCLFSNFDFSLSVTFEHHYVLFRCLQEELELILMDDQEEKQHFNFKSILEKESKTKKKKRKKDSLDTEEQKDNFEIDVKDPRFNALFTSHHFAIDPSDQQYRYVSANLIVVKGVHARQAEIPQKDEQRYQF